MTCILPDVIIIIILIIISIVNIEAEGPTIYHVSQARAAEERAGSLQGRRCDWRVRMTSTQPLGSE